MCGFVVCVNNQLGRQSFEVQPQRLLQCLRHRGPDDEGTFRSLDNSVLMTSNRLAIQDVTEKGHMPMRSPSGQFRIVFNGEIYNAPELRTRMAYQGYEFRSGSDTEVVLLLYEKLGHEMLAQIRGMFAIAIWDEEAGTLFAVRDQIGIKPLYFAEHPLGVVLGSEVRAIVATGLVRPSLDESAVASFLAKGAVQEPRTAIAGIHALPPAHWLLTDGHNTSISRFWSLRTEDVFEGDAEAAANQVRSTLTSAVADQMISDVPVAVFLSGGIDSAIVATLAQAASRSPISTISITFPEERFAEGRAAKEMAKAIGTDHHEVMVTQDDVCDELDEFILAMDQPTSDGLNTFMVSRAARTTGATVALSGLGADELFGGYPTFRTVPILAGWYGRAARLHLRPMPELVGRAVQTIGEPKLHRALDAYGISADPWVAAYAAIRGHLTVREAYSWTGHSSPISSELAPVPQDFGDEWSFLFSFDRVSALELRGYMLNQLLRDADVFSMANSIELRVPLLDQRLVELAFSIPPQFKEGGSKRLLKEALRPVLPHQMLALPKMGFAFPYPIWLQDSFGELVQDRAVAAADQLGETNLPELVTTLWSRFRRGKISWTPVWAASMLALWAARQRRLVD